MFPRDGTVETGYSPSGTRRSQIRLARRLARRGNVGPGGNRTGGAHQPARIVWSYEFPLPTDRIDFARSEPPRCRRRSKSSQANGASKCNAFRTSPRLSRSSPDSPSWPSPYRPHTPWCLIINLDQHASAAVSATNGTRRKVRGLTDCPPQHFWANRLGTDAVSPSPTGENTHNNLVL